MAAKREIALLAVPSYMYVSLRIFAPTILWLLLFSGAAFPQPIANVPEQLRQAQGLIASGHSEAAEDRLSSILRQQPSNPVALTLMGAVRTQQQGQNTKAEEFFRKAIAADPKHIPAWQRPYVGEQPQIWFHDVFYSDGRPYREREAQIIRELTGKN